MWYAYVLQMVLLAFTATIATKFVSLLSSVTIVYFTELVQRDKEVP